MLKTFIIEENTKARQLARQKDLRYEDLETIMAQLEQHVVLNYEEQLRVELSKYEEIFKDGMVPTCVLMDHS